MSTTQYYLYMGGQQHFLRAAAEIRAELLEPSMETEGWEYTKEFLATRRELKLNTQPTACATTTALGVVGVFLLGYLSEKVSDEFYERIGKRPVGRLVGALLEKFGIPERKHLEYRDIVCFNDSDVIVVIRLLVTENVPMDVDKSLSITHSIALRFLVENGKKAPVHCYKIVNGKIPNEPEFYLSLDHIDNEESAQVRKARGFNLQGPVGNS